jgi:hypothetical protein
MAAVEGGLSCKVKLPGIMDFMKDYQPLFLFPHGEKAAAAFIQLALDSHYQAFY